MEWYLEELDLAQLELLKKVFSNAMLDEEKFQTLKSSNQACQTKILSQPKMLAVVKLVGFTCAAGASGDYVLQSKNLLENAVHAIETRISALQNKGELEYEARKREHQARRMEAERKLTLEKQAREAELDKIKNIQADVHAKPVHASHADSTMGHAAASEGIFAGAGGKSSTARTFKDIGVNVND